MFFEPLRGALPRAIEYTKGKFWLGPFLVHKLLGPRPPPPPIPFKHSPAKPSIFVGCAVSNPAVRLTCLPSQCAPPKIDPLGCDQACR